MPRFDLWIGDKEDQFTLTRSQLQDIYIDGAFDALSDEPSFAVDNTFEAVNAMEACPHWPHMCDDCCVCGGEGSILPTPYNKFD